MTNEEILQDFRRRYENTLVKLSVEGKNDTLAHIRSVDNDPECVARIYMNTLDHGEISMMLGSNEYSLKFQYPLSGVFQHGVDAMCFYRIPAKQYQRGISLGNSVLTGALQVGGIGNNANSLRHVKSAFDHVTYHWDEAINLLSKGKARSVALGSNFSISLPISSSTDGVLLGHHRNTIARVGKDKEIRVCYESSFERSLGRILGRL